MGRKKGVGYVRYSVYKGVEFLAMGTAFELAERFGVATKTVRFWASPANKRRDNGHRIVAERVY